MAYYSNYGPHRGPLREWEVFRSIDILPAPNQGSPIGQADPLGPDGDGNAEFRLRVGGKSLEGRWLLVGRVFVRAHEDGRQPQ
jgi:hypothetical protein